MRLIDADKLNYKDYKVIQKGKDGREHKHTFVAVSGKKIMTQPTVDAIPVSFIRRTIISGAKAKQDVTTLHMLLAVWEQEKEKDYD